MAEEVLKKFEEQLNCSICLDTYTDPKLLQCNHVYCQQCLVRLVDRDQQGQFVLTCPTCRQVTPVLAGGVRDLQVAFHIIPLLEIRKSFEKIRVTSASGPFQGEAFDRSSSKSKVKSCSEHPEELKLFCETCQELICYQCAIKGGKHQSHDHQLLSKAFEKYKQEITSSLEPMEKQLATIGRALTQLDTHCGVISNQQAAIEANIHDSISKLRAILDARENKLIGQLHQITQSKLKTLAVQRDQLETTQVQLSSCLEFVRESLTANRCGEVLMIKTTVAKQVKELITPPQDHALSPSAKADMTFSASAEVVEACQKYGQVCTPDSPDPTKCLLTRNLDEAVVGKSFSVLLQVVNFESEPCRKPPNDLECVLVSEITCTKVQGIVERRGESQYEISYQPTVKGRHQLYIKISGQHIRGSPFSIAAKSQEKDEVLGSPISVFGSVRSPWGVAINQRGEVIVTTLREHCVSIFSPSGHLLRSFGSQGKGRGQFLYPRGVAVDGQGNILVVDGNNNRLQKFTPDGDFLALVGSDNETDSLRLHLPKDVCYNTSNNKLYIVDWNHRILVLNSDLTHSFTFGTKGQAPGRFQNPMCVACDSTGKVYAADSGNHRIQVFTAEGKFLRAFGRQGSGDGRLDRPVGVAVGTNGKVYVAESYNNRISVFTSEGRFMCSFGGAGEGWGEFAGPTGVAVDSSGVLYVCDQGNDCIQIF